MIPNKLQFHTFAFVMSFFMSGVMSLSMLALDSTTLADAFANWPSAWAIAMLVAFPFSLMVVPLTQSLVSKIVADE